MDKRLLKRRLIGATVLVALGVIFIPMILTGGRDEMSLFSNRIPSKPRAIEQLKSLQAPQLGKPAIEAKKQEIRIPVEQGVPPASDEPKKPQPEVAEEKKKDLFSLPTLKKDDNKANAKAKAWVVQVGSFSNRSNALKLQKRLRKQQYPAFVEFVKKGNGGVYRVRVGPEVKRGKAEQTAQTIQKKMGIKGVVMSHP